MRLKLTRPFPQSCPELAGPGVRHDIVQIEPRNCPVCGRWTALDARGRIGELYENGSCSRSDERTDVTPIIEARSDTEPVDSHSETVQAAVNIDLVMASNPERVTVIW